MKGLTYVVGSLAGDGLPQFDVLGGERLDFASEIDDAGPGRSSAYVDANVVLLVSVHFGGHVSKSTLSIGSGRSEAAESCRRKEKKGATGGLGGKSGR